MINYSQIGANLVTKSATANEAPTRKASPIRNEISKLEASGITRIAAGSLNDPEIVPLWFGESDLVTPEFPSFYSGADLMWLH